MKNVADKAKVATVVGKYFLLSCKNHRHYIDFRRQFTRKINGVDSFSKRGMNYLQHLARLANSAEQETVTFHGGKGFSKFDYVNHFVNLMLHLHLEPLGLSPQELCSIGQEIYDLSCYSLYGEEFLKEIEKEKNTSKADKTRESMILGEYYARKKQGEDVTIDAIRKKYENMDMNEFLQRASNQLGLNIGINNELMTDLYDESNDEEDFYEEWADYDYDDN